MGFVVSFYNEGRVFFSQSCQTGEDLIFIFLINRSDRHIQGWGRIIQRQITDNIVLVTEGVA